MKLVMLDDGTYQQLPKPERTRRTLSMPDGTAMSVIYVIQSGAFLKIGHTSLNMTFRLSMLQIGNPHKLRLLYQYPVPANCAYRLEQAVHATLRRFRVRGEWFRCTKTAATEAIGLALVRAGVAMPSPRMESGES